MATQKSHFKLQTVLFPKDHYVAPKGYEFRGGRESEMRIIPSGESSVMYRQRTDRKSCALRLGAILKKIVPLALSCFGARDDKIKEVESVMLPSAVRTLADDGPRPAVVYESDNGTGVFICLSVGDK